MEARRRQIKTWFARAPANTPEVVLPPDGDRSARLRAMAAFGRLDDAALQRLLGDLSKRQISRLKAGEVTPSIDQLELVAQATGTPLWFVRYGFAPPADVVDRSLLERVEVLEGEVAELRARSAGPG